MGGEKIKFITYAVITVFILSIGYFAGSIYIDLQNGPERAQTEFTAFAEKTSTLMYSASLHDDAYIKGLQDIVLGNSRIVAVFLSVDNEIQFAYPISSKLITVDDKGMPILHVSSPLLKIFSIAIPTQLGQTATIKAAVYILHPKDIYDSARISFLVILGCTLIVLVLLAYITGFSKNQSETTEDLPTDYSYVETNAEESQKTEIETIPIVFRNTDESSYQFSIHDSDIDAEKDAVASTESEITCELEKDFKEEILPELLEESIITDPMGLFSNTTGVGWESYMETRLDAELVRAASSEQDLTLMLIRIKGIEENKPLLKKAATILLEYFKFRDFVFEYKNDGFSGILLNINLDQAMLVAESLYAKLINLMREEETITKVGIGISTRTLRLIPGSRIITEANEAIEKSFTENDLPIVAFRVNPEKYRQFVSDSTKS